MPCRCRLRSKVGGGLSKGVGQLPARLVSRADGRCHPWVAAVLGLTVLSWGTVGVPAASGAATGPLATTWVPLSPATSPPGRHTPSMAYDPAIGQLVLFGGQGADDRFLADTWTYNGTTWAEQSPATSPPARVGASMTYDPAIGQLVLFGGTGANGQDLVDTWAYNGTTWAKESPATSPPARSVASMAYDPAIGRLVLFGGTHETPSKSFVLFGDTWTYNGTTWARQSPTTNPGRRYGASMAYDPATGRLVLFGGQGVYAYQSFGDTWTYNGAAWAQQHPASSPPGRFGASMAYDPPTRQLVLFSGDTYAAVGVLSDTWTWDGTTWAQQAPETSPPPALYNPMDYDASGQLVLLDGGVPGMWAYRVVGDGHWLVAADGEVFSFGAPFYGSVGNAHLNQPVVGMAAAPGGDGYYLVGKDGGVFAFGAGVRFLGSLGATRHAQPVVGMAVDPYTGGYWLAAADGGVFSFGAPFNGSMGNAHLNQPVVGMAAAPGGGGYYLVGKDGGVFALGPGANFYGSMGGTPLAKPVVGMAVDPATGGYWLVGAGGAVFSFNAPFYGSMGNAHLNQPVVGMAAAPGGNGYWLVGKDGGVFAFGPGASFHGSTAGTPLAQPVVGMTGQ